MQRRGSRVHDHPRRFEHQRIPRLAKTFTSDPDEANVISLSHTEWSRERTMPVARLSR